MEKIVKDQQELKANLLELIDFISSADYYKLSDNRRKLLLNKKMCMETYLNVLNMEIYEDIDHIYIPDMGTVSIMSSLFNTSLNNNSLSWLNKELEKKEESNDDSINSTENDK